MKELTTALTHVLAAEAVEWMSAESREERLLDLRKTIDVLEAEAVRTLATFDDRREFRRDGYSSSTAYLKHQCRMTGNQAKRLVAEARALDAMPITKKLFLSGELSHDHVRVLIRARERAPEAFAADEAMLCGIAADLPFVAQVQKAVAYWEQAVGEAPADIEDQRRRRALHLSKTLDGMVRLDGWLDAESGDELMAALDSATPPPSDLDDRTPAQRRADGLMDLVRSGGKAMGAGPGPVVHTDLDTLVGDGPPTLAETDSETVLTKDAIDRISCDAEVTRIVFGPDSRPVDVGRSKRVITPAQRRALATRDRHCRFTGCDRPAGWCDGHHIVPWSKGGFTDLDNLVLLCRHHHTLVHDGGWQLTGTTGELEIRRPDRSLLRSPP